MKIAIVTGASSGLGRETAVQLAKAESGLDGIWIVARRAERLEALAGELEGRARLGVFGLDLASDEGLAALRAALEEEKPEVKILVNAAGFGKIARAEDMPLEFAAGMVEINCRALVAITQLALPYMRGGGRILQYASSAAFLPQPDFAVYAATKAFVLSYSRALNEELRRRKIAVTAVCPGPVETEFFAVAGAGRTMAGYKKLALADAKSVVRRALYDSARGRSVSVYGAWMKALRVCAKLLPHGPIIRALGRRA